MCLTGPTVARNPFDMNRLDRRCCIAPMMDWSDSSEFRRFLNYLRACEIACSSSVAAICRRVCAGLTKWTAVSSERRAAPPRLACSGSRDRLQQHATVCGHRSGFHVKGAKERVARGRHLWCINFLLGSLPFFDLHRRDTRHRLAARIHHPLDQCAPAHHHGQAD
jgi:hypothetical protein